MGGKTGLYMVSDNSDQGNGNSHKLTKCTDNSMVFIDLTAGNPKITNTARCIKANYNNGIQHHKGEKSGVLITSDEQQQHAANAIFVDMTIGNPKITDTARCITANYGKSGMSHHNGELSGVLLIKEGTKKGYAEAHPGDSITLSYPGNGGKRGRVGKGVSQTLTCQPQGVMELHGRIRRLTPRECFRIQGFDEDQIDRVLAVVSDSQAYKQAGNSVTVNVVHAIGLKLRAIHEEWITTTASAKNDDPPQSQGTIMKRGSK